MGRLAQSLVVLAALLFAVHPVAAQSGSASDVQRLLELLVKKGVVSQEEAAALQAEFSKNPTPDKATGLVETQNPEPQKKEPAANNSSLVKIGGWVQTRWTNATGTTNPLELRRARITLDGDLTDKVSYRVQLDAVRSPILLDARVDLNYFSFLKLTVGQFKIPFSHENLITSRVLIPIERSQVVLNLVPGRDNGSNGRDIGAQLSGIFFRASGRPLFEYAFGVFSGAGTNRTDDNGHKDLATRLVLYPWTGFSMAGDYYSGATGPQCLARDRAGVELAYTRRPYSLRGEYIWGRDAGVHKAGWYTQFAYRVRPQWEALFRFDNYDPRRQAGSDETRTYLLGGNWYFARWAKLQVNYGLVDNQKRPQLGHLFMTQLQFQYKPDTEQ